MASRWNRSRTVSRSRLTDAHRRRTSRRAGANRPADVGTIRELAVHADIRTTTIYTLVNDARLESAIAERTRQRQSVRRARTAD